MSRSSISDNPPGRQPTLPPESPHTLTPRRYAALLVLIVSAAFALRIWHVTWGLPNIFEEAFPFMKAWGFWNWGRPGVDLNPHFFNYPALTFYFQWGAQALHYVVGHFVGSYRDLEAFRAAFESDPTRAIAIARLLNAAFDVGTVTATAAVARRLAGSGPSLIVAGLSAVNPLQVQMSQQINVDVPMTFFLVIALWYILRLYETGATRAYIGAGVAIGLAAACKYTAAILLAPLLVAHMLRVFGSRTLLRSLLDVQLFLSVMLAEILFLILNPYILLDVAAFKRGFGFELQHMAAGHFGIPEESSSLWFYVTQTIPGALGWVLVVTAFGGLVALLKKKDQLRRWAPILTYLAILLLLLSLWKMRADRYFLPALPGIFLLIAVAVERLTAALPGLSSDRSAGIRRRLTTGAVVILAATALGAESVTGVLGYHATARKTDTRTIARNWISSRFDDDIVVVMAPIGLSLPPPRTVLALPYASVNFHLLAALYDARWYVDCDLVVGSDFDRARYFADPERYRPFLQYFYDSLDTRWRQLAIIETGDDRRGPRIWLYGPPNSATADSFDESLLRRLDTVPSMQILAAFGLNLTNVLAHKGKIGKADQVWSRISSRALDERDPIALLESFAMFPEEVRAIPRMRHLMEQLAWKAAEGVGAGKRQLTR